MAISLICLFKKLGGGFPPPLSLDYETNPEHDVEVVALQRNVRETSPFKESDISDGHGTPW